MRVKYFVRIRDGHKIFFPKLLLNGYGMTLTHKENVETLLLEYLSRQWPYQ